MKVNMTHFLCALCALFLSSTAVCAATELTAETNKPSMSTYALKEEVTIFFKINGYKPKTTAQLEIRVQNEYGQLISAKDAVDVTTDEAGSAEYVYNTNNPKLGYYEVHAKLSDGTSLAGEGTRPVGIISYAIVPDPKTRVDYGDKNSRFGVRGAHRAKAPIAPYLGSRQMLETTDWARMEPDYPEQFMHNGYKTDLKKLSHSPKLNTNNNLVINGVPWNVYSIALVTMSTLPSWAILPGTAGTSRKKFGELNATGEEYLPNFSLELAKAFAADNKDQESRYYQVTWEPTYPWGYGGSPSGLVKMYQKAYTPIHQGDPNAIVAGPTLHNNPIEEAQFKKLIDAGLGKYIDAISFQPKTIRWPAEKNGMPQILKQQIDYAEQVSKKTFQFIGTEQGLGDQVCGGQLNKAMGDIRTSIMMLGEGASFDIGFYAADFFEGKGEEKINRGYGYYWNLNTKINFGTDKLGPKIVVPAYAAMTYFLDGTKTKGRLKNLSGTQLGYEFQRENKSIRVVWDYNTTSNFPVPPNSKICDWMGNCESPATSDVMIGGAPVYFIEETSR